MIKPLDPTKVEEQALGTLEAFLEGLPQSRVDFARSIGPAEVIDICAEFHLDQEVMRLFCEIKASGQPRHVRAALDQLARIQRDRHSALWRSPRTFPSGRVPFAAKTVVAISISRVTV